MPDVEVNSENGRNLWSNLLKDVKEKSSKTAHVPICLLMLGNAGSGKSTLIARLQKSDPKYGVGLEFDYIEIKDESIDENKKLNVWISSGDPYHANLLKYALNENNFGYSCCMITVSLSEPWNLVDNLEEWLKILKMHIDRLKLTSKDIQFYKDSLTRQFQEYSEPDLEKEKQAILGKRRDTDFNYLHPSASDDSEKVFIPLEEGIFEKNLGIPIIVVITKTDNIFTLEQDFDYNDDKFDFIQMHLRKICLKYGAALCYTSLKDDRNCDLLLNYLLHRCYGFSMINTASVIEKDAIFIPAGWDSNKKINILTENLLEDIKQQSYNSFITKPLSIVRANAQNRLTEPEIAEDEQVFLMKQQALIQRNRSTEGNTKFDVQRSGLPTNPSTTSRNRKNLPGISGPTTNIPITGAQQANEGVLANFFSSLLNKRGVVTGSPTPNQQLNSCELSRCDDSVSENDESQRDDLLSNSMSASTLSNPDSIHLKMTENSDMNNQCKIDATPDLNKFECPMKITNADKKQLHLENVESKNLTKIMSSIQEETECYDIPDENNKDDSKVVDNILNIEEMKINNFTIKDVDEITESKISENTKKDFKTELNSMPVLTTSKDFENNEVILNKETQNDDIQFKENFSDVDNIKNREYEANSLNGTENANKLDTQILKEQNEFILNTDESNFENLIETIDEKERKPNDSLDVINKLTNDNSSECADYITNNTCNLGDSENIYEAVEKLKDSENENFDSTNNHQHEKSNIVTQSNEDSINQENENFQNLLKESKSEYSINNEQNIEGNYILDEIKSNINFINYEKEESCGISDQNKKATLINEEHYVESDLVSDKINPDDNSINSKNEEFPNISSKEQNELKIAESNFENVIETIDEIEREPNDSFDFINNKLTCDNSDEYKVNINNEIRDLKEKENISDLVETSVKNLKDSEFENDNNANDNKQLFDSEIKNHQEINETTKEASFEDITTIKMDMQNEFEDSNFLNEIDEQNSLVNENNSVITDNSNIDDKNGQLD